MKLSNRVTGRPLETADFDSDVISKDPVLSRIGPISARIRPTPRMGRNIPLLRSWIKGTQASPRLAVASFL